MQTTITLESCIKSTVYALTKMETLDIHSGNTIAFIIAIEDYRFSHEQGINPVLYARNDATKFKNLLTDEFNIPEENITLWLDKDALKTAFENELIYHIRQLSKDDRFIFYYAGHGFHQNGHNRLTCWDTYPTTLNETTVSLDDILLKPLNESECAQSLIFLDCCATNLNKNTQGRDMLSSMNIKEFENFIKPNKYRALFMSCSPGQKSYPNNSLEHGIWTWHLIEALKGNMPAAIQRNNYITDASLKNYLSAAIPDFITNNTTISDKQRPYAEIASTNEFLIRKLPIHEKTAESDTPQLILNPDSIIFRKTISIHVSKSHGYKQSHFPPIKINSASKSYIQQVFTENIKTDIQNIYIKTKEVFSLRRREITTEVTNEGGFAECNFFRYTIHVDQNPYYPAEGLITRILLLKSNRSDLPKNFDEIFPNHIDQIVVDIDKINDFDDLVDRFENLEDSDGGKLVDNKMNGTIEYTLANSLRFNIDINENKIIINSSKKIKLLEFITESAEGLKKISHNSIKSME